MGKGWRRSGRSVAAWLCSIAAIALSACGGGGGSSPGETSAGREYAPLSVGNRWVYRSWTGNSDTASQLELAKVTGTTSIQGHDAVVLQFFKAIDGSYDGVQHLSVSDGAVTQWPDPRAQTGSVVLPALDLLRFPLTPGSSYQQMDKTYGLGADYDGDGHDESLRIQVQVTVIGFGTIQTDAGALGNAAHVRSVVTQTGIYSSGRTPFTATTTMDDWYAPGIGLVREDSATTVSSGTASPSRHFVVASYEIDGRRSKSTAPVATLTAPALSGVQGPFTHLQVSFSEPMDASTIGSQGIELRNASGTLVPLTRQGGGQDWSFYPANGALASGMYTLSVTAGATDLVGNSAAAASWTFDVDGTAPVVVASSPANNAAAVPLDAVITLDFSEEIDPGSAAGAVQLVSDSYIPIDVTVQGKHMTVRPQTALAMRTSYRLYVQSSVRDKVGNSMTANYSLSFQTDPGQFDYAKTIATGSSPEAVAVGDVTGDGRNDVVMTNWFYFDATTDYKLFVFPQQGNGTLGTPVAYTTQAAYNCRPSSVAVADINGDGRKDVIIGESGCGIEIFLQGADGVLVSNGVIATAESHKIRAVDLDGDGRMDIVGIGWGTNQVAVWKQTAAGTLAGPSVYALEHAGWEDLDVGDINGDGRPDVVVSSGQGYGDKTLAILPQQADGSFASPRYSSIGSTSWAVAVGDVNGDGRNDVIVSRAYESSIGVFYQDASGNLGPMQIVGTYNTIYAIEVADVNGDGAQDVVVKTDYGFGVLFQQPDGSLGPVQTYRAGISGSFNPHSITVGDINGDGWPDLVGAGLAYVLNRGPDATSNTASATKSVTKAPSKKREALTSRGWAPMRTLPGKSGLFPANR